MESNPLETFLVNVKKDFLNDLKSGKGLEDWVVVNGNEAGGTGSLLALFLFPPLLTDSSDYR